MRAAFIFCLAIVASSLFGGDYQSAFEAYQLGERAETIEERAKYFNKALSLYSQNEVEDGKLYYNIGNCYYQLNQLGMAIWYYTKAQKLLPRDTKIEKNLQKAQKQAQTPISSWDHILKSVFFFHFKLKVEEQKAIFALLSLILTLFISLAIWIKKPFFKPLISIFSMAVCLFGFSLAKEHLNQGKALIIQPTLLRCDAGMQYKEIDHLLSAVGERCKVIEVSADGDWVKIKTTSGKKGYAQSDHIRFLK